MANNQHKIAIVGGGAVGLVFAALLSDVADVLVITRRPEQAEAINSRGISFRRKTGHERTFKEERIFKNVRASTDVNDLRDRDAIIVAVKSFDTAAVARAMNKVIKIDAVVLSVQNGLEGYPVLREHIGNPSRVFDGVTYLGAERCDDRSVVNGDNQKVVLDSGAAELAEVMVRSELAVVASPNVKQAVWDKMALSTAQNALSAVMNLHMGQMLESKDALHRASQLLIEFEKVAAAEGVKFDYSLMDALCNNWKDSTFYPSMWQDLHAGRRTEIDAINGVISELGRKHGIPTPHNDEIVAQVKVLERKFL
jgi:2-dehydropantoate 2-reductase